MKIFFDIIRVYWKIRFLGGSVHKKPIYREGLPEKGGWDSLQIYVWGLAKKKGESFWGGGVDTPMHTMLLLYHDIMVLPITSTLDVVEIENIYKEATNSRVNIFVINHK